MIPGRAEPHQKAFYLLVWRAWLAMLVAIVLMATRSLDLAIAFLIGANVRFYSL